VGRKNFMHMALGDKGATVAAYLGRWPELRGMAILPA
jgi:hypothetical protein